MGKNLKAGTYSVNAAGRNGSLPMKVELSTKEIKNIIVDTSTETRGIADLVFKKIPKDIIDSQSLNIDAVSGATITSKGIVEGVSQAIKLAGGNPDDFKKEKEDINNNTEEKQFETDVVIIGAGGAGLAAACAALDNGKRTIILEKYPQVGGNTMRTGGQINSADPKWQNTFPAFNGERQTLDKLLNLEEDTIPDEYQSDLKELKKEIKSYLADLNNGKNYLFDSKYLHRIQTLLGGTRTDLSGHTTYGNYDLVKYLTDNALNTINWLKSKGVEFDEENVTEPVGALWRRAREPEKAEGFGFIEPLKNYVLTHGGQIITDTRAKKLITKNGKVCGVKAIEDDGTKVTVNAKSVVLTTGGYSANLKMVKKYDNYWGNLPDKLPTTNSPADTGDGIEMGKAVNADLVDMQFAQLMPSADPETGDIFTGIDCPPSDFVFVNKQGKRFVNEYAARDELCKALFDQGGIIYNISDSEIAKTRFNSTDEKLQHDVDTGHCFKANTIEELAEQINLDPKVLKDTIDKYNEAVRKGVDEEFGKTSFNHEVIKPPFYATPRSPATHHTMGGLKIDVDTHVINTSGKIIDGLFAAGEVAGGIHAGNRLGGNALADIFTFGQVAGNNASKVE